MVDDGNGSPVLFSSLLNRDDLHSVSYSAIENMLGKKWERWDI